MRLNKFQETFKDTMLQPVHALDEVDEDLRALFIDNEISVEDRLKVYQNNIVGSVSASLCATFPLLEKLVGEDFLKSMARAFVFDHPPTSGCLHSYGTGFDDFVRSYEPAQTLPYLADIASLELAINRAYYAPDDLPLAAESLSKIPEHSLDGIQLLPRQSVTLLESQYPILHIKDFCEDEDHYDAPDLTTAAETRLMIYRPGLDVEIMPLDKDEFFILKQLSNSKTLGLSIQETLDAYPDFDFTVFLQKNISLETFLML